MDVMQAIDCFAEALGDEAGTVGVSKWEDDGELFTAVAGNGVALALQLTLECGGYSDQAFIAGLVSGGVVEFLEVIDVDDEETDGVASTLGVSPFMALSSLCARSRRVWVR